MRSLLLATAALGLSGALATAHADLISIGLQLNGGAITTVATGNGNAVFNGGFGAFSVNTVSGSGSPPLTEPTLLSNSINIQSGEGSNVLNVFVTEQGLSSPTGINQFLSSFTSNDIRGLVTSVLEQTLISTGNGLYTGTVLDSHTFTNIGVASSTDATPSLAAPYSETAEVHHHHDRRGRCQRYDRHQQGAGAGDAGASGRRAARPRVHPPPSRLTASGSVRSDGACGRRRHFGLKFAARPPRFNSR